MFLKTTVTKWKNSVGHNMIRGDTEFFLNTNMMTDITTLSGGGSKMLFADTIGVYKKKPKVLECSSTVDDIKVAGDAESPPKSIDLRIFPKNNTFKKTVPLNIKVSDMVYVRANGTGGKTWIYYHTSKGDMKLILADLTMDEFENLLKI